VLVTSSNAVRSLAGRPVRPVTVEVAAFCGRRSDRARGKARWLQRGTLGGRAIEDLIALVGKELRPSARPLLYVTEKTRPAISRRRSKHRDSKSRPPFSIALRRGPAWQGLRSLP